MVSIFNQFLHILKFVLVHESLVMSLNIHALMESLQDRYSRSPKALQECSAALGSDAPAPLSRSGHIISKEEVLKIRA